MFPTRGRLLGWPTPGTPAQRFGNEQSPLVHRHACREEPAQDPVVHFDATNIRTTEQSPAP